MATRSPEVLKSLTQSVLSGIANREAEARRRQGLSQDQLRREQGEERISKRALGEPTTDIDIRNQQIQMERAATRGLGSKRTARSQVSMIGTPPPTPER